MKFISPVLLALLAAQATAQQVIMVRDPETGQMRAATEAELAQLQPKNPHAKSMLTRPPLKPEAQRDGSQRLSLGRTQFSYSLVQRGADGKLHDQCVKGKEAAAKAVNAPREAHHEDR